LRLKISMRNQCVILGRPPAKNEGAMYPIDIISFIIIELYELHVSKWIQPD